MDFYEKQQIDNWKYSLDTFENSCGMLLKQVEESTRDVGVNVCSCLNGIKWEDSVGDAIKNKLVNSATVYAKNWHNEYSNDLKKVIESIQRTIKSLKEAIS